MSTEQDTQRVSETYRDIATEASPASLDDKVLAFGHSFFSQGRMELPMSTAYVHTVIPGVFSSFKLSSSLKQAGAEVQILFHGTATRWPAVLADDTHPAHGLYQEVADTVAGVSCACAEAYVNHLSAEEA